MALQVPDSQDEFVRARGLLQEVYGFNTGSIRPVDVTEIAALSEGGKLSVDELRPLYYDAIQARALEVEVAQSTRTRGR